MGFVGMWEEGRGGMKGQRTLVVSHVPARRVSKHASARSTNDGYSIVPPATDGLPAYKPMMGRMTSGEWMTVDVTESRLNDRLCCATRYSTTTSFINRICVLSCATVDAPCISLSPNPLDHAPSHSITQSHTRSPYVSLSVSKR